MEASLKLYYVLLLEDGYYYVGVTDHLNRRLTEHKNGQGASWTKLHKYVKLLEVGEATSEFEEDLQVKKYMKEYGFDRVRGGTYSSPFLDDTCKTFLQREFNHASNNCMKCGKSGHYVVNCPSSVATKQTSTKVMAKKRDEGCTRCGRSNHKIEDCYATVTAAGKILCRGTTQKGTKCSKQARNGGYCKIHAK